MVRKGGLRIRIRIKVDRAVEARNRGLEAENGALEGL
jgi:hypothetical protein